LLVEVGQPPRQRLAQRQAPAFQQRQRADTVRIPQREVDRDLAALAPPDHDRRRRRKRVDQRCRIVGVLVHVRDKRLRALAAREPSAVVHDRAPMGRQLVSGIAPQNRRAAGAVDAQDRLAGPMLLVVERDTVHADPGAILCLLGSGHHFSFQVTGPTG
jgi:hypothetical protein